ncbi:Uncharacterised protein [Vibrio cholerae]|nr:Uncharacterised protein [Vibrio cholerae]
MLHERHLIQRIDQTYGTAANALTNRAAFE